MFRLRWIAVALPFALLAQTGAAPAFGVASVKPNTSPWAERFQNPMGGGFQPGGRLHLTNLSLLGLIQFAYANHDSSHWLPLVPSRVIGGPAWRDSVGYDVDAKPNAPTDSKETWLMLQTLLAERFHLALRHESRELPVYLLTVARGGLKLPNARPVDCISFPPGTAPKYVPGKADCGYVAGPLQDLNSEHFTGSKVRMADFAAKLAMFLDRPVVDRTGFTGDFDLKLSYAADAPGTRAGSVDSNLFAALEEQLGLKLAPGKAPVDVLVIDHAEKPAAN